ncbi:gallinacin-9-like [Sminthopsis crassicaudata]|uniref:gallinacin-9-like n=1 Tax=Sminthopsis crassicaudata TaxID=9301 RepID=UPI003D69821B
MNFRVNLQFPEEKRSLLSQQHFFCKGRIQSEGPPVRFTMSQFMMRNLYLVFMVLFDIFPSAETDMWSHRDTVSCVTNRGGTCSPYPCNTDKTTLGTCFGGRRLCCKY